MEPAQFGKIIGVGLMADFVGIVRVNSRYDRKMAFMGKEVGIVVERNGKKRKSRRKSR